MAQYEDKVLQHEVDGIREYDNPMPGWLMGILWGALAFSVLYIGFYALAFGPASVESEYRDEEVSERAKLQAYFDENPLVPPSTEELLAGAKKPKMIAAGRARFAKTCASCHGDQGQGLIGPNLADSHWLHGGKVSQVFNTVVKGVPAKGMPPWGRAIPPEELAALVSFIRSMHGTKPPDPKGPEGKLEEPEAL